MIADILCRIALAIVILFIIYMFAIMPRVLHRPDTSLFQKVYFAHRGLHDNDTEAPENSMAAFHKAVKAGFGMEMDVHVTKDGIPVVFHDFTLERICGKNIEIEECTYEDLQQFTLCSSKERIPRFEDVLNMVNGRVPLIVEIKSEKVDVAFCSVIDNLLRAYQGEYCIESFNPMVLWWFRRHHNNVVRGQLSSNFRKDGGYTHIMYFFMEHLLLNFLTKPDFIAYNHKFWQEPGRRICRRLYRCPAAAWTIQSQGDLEEMWRNFDVFIFDSFCPIEAK